MNDIGLSMGEPSPVSNREVLQYTASVPYNLSSVAVSPATDLEVAVIQINGKTIASGESSSLILLETGSNPISVKVSAAELMARVREAEAAGKKAVVEITTDYDAA